MKERKQRKVYRLSEEQVAYIVEHYHDTPAKEIADFLGVSVYTVKSRRDKLGLKHDAEYMTMVNRERAIRCNNAERLNCPESRRRRVLAMKKILAAEKSRVVFGLPQKTRRRFTNEPRACLLQRNRLQRLGYVVDNVEKVAYWTEGTKRATRLEKLKRGEKKGSLKCWYDFAELKEK